MKRILFSAILALGIEAVAFDSSPYRHHKELKGESAGEELVRFDLDADVFRGSTEDFADLRVIKVDGETETEIPYLVSRVDRYVPPESAESIRTVILSFDEEPDGSVEFTLRLLEEEKRCATLDFETPLRNFEKNVSVQSSKDGENWRTLIDNALIFDHERFLDFRKTSLALPRNDALFFKVRIGDATDEQRSVVRQISRTVGDQIGSSVTESSTLTTRSFRINELKFLTAEREAKDVEDEREYPVTIDKIEAAEDGRCTEIYLDAGNAPLSRFKFVTEDRNFRREVCVQIRTERSSDDWRTIKRGRIHSYTIGDFHDENLRIEFDSQRSEAFRILVQNGDSPSLEIEQIVASGDVYEVLFLSEPELPFAVYYGSAEASPVAPAYDTAALVLAKGRGIPAARWTLGEERKNLSFTTASARLGWTEQRWLLWLVIALIVSGLAVVLIKAGRNIGDGGMTN